MTFTDHLGLVVVERADGVAILQLDADERHLNRAGVVHGGVLASMADSAIGNAVQTLVDLEVYRVVVAQLTASFMRQAYAGQLMARGVVTSMGRRLAFGEAEIRQGDTLVAKATGVCYVKRRRPEG